MNNKAKSITYFYEKFKAVLLVSLIILCIVQIGILLSSQSGSFPISLFPNQKSTSPISIDASRDKYLLPYRVAISTGFDKDHYVIPNGSKEYDTLWKGAKEYIVQALKTKPKQTQLFSEDAWGTLVANKPYTFEFKTPIPIDIIKWTLDLESDTSAGEGLTSIYKVVICPNDSDNSFSDTLYLRDDKNIYTYDLKDFQNTVLNEDEFNSIYTKQPSENAKNYQMAIEKYRGFQISQDLMGIFSSKSPESYPNITCEPITGLDEQKYTYDDYSQMALELFGNTRNDYDFDKDVNGSVVFKKADGVYRLYKNSIVEYRFSGNQTDTAKPSVLEAYKKAIALLSEIRNQNEIMTNVSVYLNSIQEEQGSYTFNFDYSVSLGEGKGEIPIMVKNYQIPNSSNQLDNSISIKASSKKVLRFAWLALKFKADKSLELYRWNFGDMYDKVSKTYAELKKEEFSVKDFGVYYVPNYPKTHEQLITPSFVLFTKDGRYDVLMERNNK